MNRTRLAVALAVLWSAAPAAAQQPSAVRRYVDARQHEILREFTTLLALPNVARDRAAIRRNADTLVAMLRRRGLSPRILEAGDAAPAVYGEWLVPGATRTLVFYAHYDGQPADSTRWAGTHPWRPTWRTAAHDAGGRIVDAPAPGTPVDPDWRLYARSASDDKAGVMAIITAPMRSGRPAAAPRPTSSCSSRARRRRAHRTWPGCWARIARCSAGPTPGSWSTGRCTSPGGSRWCSACAAT
jgi:hypothetical protein